jgi:hypothetical protein
MQTKLTLNLDQLAVESFAASTPAQEPNADARTCLDTNCGNIQCCA